MICVLRDDERAWVDAMHRSTAFDIASPAALALVVEGAGERVAPEFVQDAATPESLANALLPLVQAGATREKAVAQIAAVRSKLAAPDARSAAEHVADIAAELINANG